MRIYLLATSTYAALAVFVRGALRHDGHDVILHTFSQAVRSENLIIEADVVIPLLNRNAPTLPEVYQTLRAVRKHHKTVLGLTVEPIAFKLKGAHLIDIGHDPEAAVNRLRNELSRPQLAASKHMSSLSIPAVIGALFLLVAVIFVMVQPYLAPDDMQVASLPTYIPTAHELVISPTETSTNVPALDTSVPHTQTFDEDDVISTYEPASSTTTDVTTNPQISLEETVTVDTSEASSTASDESSTPPGWSGGIIPTVVTPTSSDALAYAPNSQVNTNADAAVASIFANPTSGEAPLTVMFENDSLGTISNYAWDFNGDGVTDSTAKVPPPFTYSEQGFYRVSLNVTGPGGEGFPDEIVIIVFESSDQTLEATATTTANFNGSANNGSILNDDPVASFFPNPSSGDAPLTVTFENDTLGEASSYAWDFNDDGVIDSTAKIPQPYTYTSDGVYKPKLTVTGPGGYSDTFTSSVIVFESPTEVTAPEARFAISPMRGPVPLQVTITNQSVGEIITYRWDYNSDGMPDSTKPVPGPLTFNQPGQYTISLVVAGPDGVSDPFTQTIEVLSVPSVTPPITATPTHTATATEMPSATVTVTPTLTATATAIATSTLTETLTTTPTSSATVTSTPTLTATPTQSATATSTQVPTSSQ